MAVDAEADQGLGEAVKAVHRSFPTGVTIVTTCVEGQPYGLAVNAFSSVSLDPPLVLVCVAATSSTYPRLFLGTHMAVNILASDQASVAGVFAKSGGDKFAEIAWTRGGCGAPILDGVSAHLEIEIETRIPAYTHTIFIGRVTDAKASGRPPLVYLNASMFDSELLRPAT
jgi:flavin reductase (DIM6/NTAB) family NADH-FMN oxidoreductase RutF